MNIEKEEEISQSGSVKKMRELLEEFMKDDENREDFEVFLNCKSRNIESKHKGFHEYIGSHRTTAR
jgi:hypothetical protein